MLPWSLVSSCRPRNGGRFCVGRRMKFRSCNTEPCPRGRKDFREEQCSHFDGKHFNINGLPPTVRWVPKYSGSEYTDILLKRVLWIWALRPLFRRKHTPVPLKFTMFVIPPPPYDGTDADSVLLLSYFAYTARVAVAHPFVDIFKPRQHWSNTKPFHMKLLATFPSRSRFFF